MLNMTIKQFEEKLERSLETLQKLKGQLDDISCYCFTESIFCLDSEMLLAFASRKAVPVMIRRNEESQENMRYKYSICYGNGNFSAYSSEEDYQTFKERGLVPQGTENFGK